MQRRNFLGGLAGILAASAAPAIIHNAMKIHVPKPLTMKAEYDFNPFIIAHSREEFEPLVHRTLMMIDEEPEPAIKAYVDRHYQEPFEHRSGNRGQVIDTSRGLYTYRVPLHAGKSNSIVLVPHDERVLRFA